jgi:hypothetical protein
VIRVQEVATAILFNLGEMYSRKHSDPELIESINTILRYLNVALVNRDSNWIVKEKEVTPKNGKATLPSDFIRTKDYLVKDGTEQKTYDGKYRIVRNTLYIDEPGVIEYYYTIAPVATMEDEIDLPSIFAQLLIRFGTGLIKGDLGKNQLDSMLSHELDNLSQSDNYPVIERPMEFYV